MTVGQKTYTFAPNLTLANEDMFATEESLFHTMHNWIDLSACKYWIDVYPLGQWLIYQPPDGRGYVIIDHPERYDLPKPYMVRVNRTSDGPAYMMTVFHQLHCLVGLDLSALKLAEAMGV